MAEALSQVRQALGSDAVILHTRSYRQGGFFGLFGRTVVEVTAARSRDIAAQQNRNRRDGRGGGSARAGRTASGRDRRELDRSSATGASSTPGRGPAPAAQSRPASQSVANQSAGDLIRRTYKLAQAELAQQQKQQEAASAASAAPQPSQAPAAPQAAGGEMDSSSTAVTSTPPAMPGKAEEGSQLASEMRMVRQMVSRLMAQQQDSGGAVGGAEAQRTRLEKDLPQPLFDQYLHLLEQEVSAELAEQVVTQVRQKLQPSELGEPEKVRQAVLEALAASVPTADGCLGSDASIPALAPTGDGRPRTIALVGPTGVGKTTTVAKLAATFKLRHGCAVGLITLDTYRIAAVEQLRTYAQIIGVPLHVVSGESQFPEALEQCRDCDVVLIDTAGRSQRDDPRLEQLSRLIDIADPHEVHLVLSSTCTQKVILDAIDRFSRVRTDRLIFTKLDEAVNFGVIVNVARKVDKQLSYLTTGQEVPHQIEPMWPGRVAQLIVTGALGPASQERTVA